MAPEEVKKQRQDQADLLRARVDVIKHQVEEHGKRYKLADATKRFLNDLQENYSLLTERYICENLTAPAKAPSKAALFRYHNDLHEQLYQYQRETLFVKVAVTRLNGEVEKLKKALKKNGSKKV